VGASTVTTHMIMFIAVLGIASGLLVTIKSYTDRAQGTIKIKSDDYDQRIRTDITIDMVSHDNETNLTWIYVRNTGHTTMKLSDIDVYIDGWRFPRDASNRTIEVTSDTDNVNIGLWDAKEQLLIKADLWLNNTVTHETIVVTPYGVRDSESFSI